MADNLAYTDSQSEPVKSRIDQAHCNTEPGSGENNVTLQGAQQLDNGTCMMSSSNGLHELNAGGVNGEIGMEVENNHQYQSSLSSEQIECAAEVDVADDESNDRYKSGDSSVAGDPPSSTSSSHQDLWGTWKIGGLSTMDAESVSSYSASQDAQSEMSPYPALDGSEMTDSRDSTSMTGVAMEVDVMTSSSSQSNSKVNISDDSETVTSLDLHNSDEPDPRGNGGMKSKRPPKSKGTPWIPLSNLSTELDHGYRILRDLMGDKCKSFNWAFMDPVDTQKMGLWDYHDRIPQPMWLRKIQFKFVDGTYQSITEFVVDVRLVLENCYRYNGMKHWVTKQAQTLESTLQQKLSLLPRNLQEKTDLYVTSKGRYGAGDRSFSSTSSGRRRFTGKFSPSGTTDYKPLAASVRKDLEETDKEKKRQQIVARKEEIAQYFIDLNDWERELMQEGSAKYMGSMWEIPFIGQFLYLCQTPLRLGEISFYELERALAVPKESSLLRRIFTSLLCTPYQRSRLENKQRMPYKVWEAKLREYVRYWYTYVEEDEEGNISVQRACSSIGIPYQFFEVLGNRFPMDHVRYHEMSFYERVWMLKTLCDYLYTTQSSIRRAIEAQPINDQRELLLGYDRDDSAYIHFPQFCGADLRIYRRSRFPEPVVEEKKMKPKVKVEPKEAKGESIKAKATSEEQTGTATPPSTPARTRPSRLRKKVNPVLRHGINSESELKQAEQSKKEHGEDKMNGEIKEETDLAGSLKEPHSLDNATTDTSTNNGNIATDSQSGVTDSGNASEVATSAAMPPVNDNNSNNRELLEHRTSPVLKATVEVAKDSSGDIKSSHVVVKEQINKDDTSGDGATVDSSNDQPLSLDLVKEESSGRDKHVKDDSESAADPSTERTSGANDKEVNGFAQNADHLSGSDKDTKSSDVTSGLDNDSKLPVRCEEQNSVQNKDIKEECMDSEGTVQKVSKSEDEQAMEKENNTSFPSGDCNGEDSKQNINPSASQGTIKSAGDDQNNDMNDEIKDTNALSDSKPSPAAATSWICWSPPRPTTPLPEREEVLPAMDEFELVCDSVEGLRALIKKFSGEPEEIVIPAKGKKKKKTIFTKPARRRRCEIELYDKLSNMLIELEPWEGKLVKAATRTREKLNKEATYYEPPDPDKNLKDIWVSEESSSESESDSSDSDSNSDSDSDSSSSSEDNEMDTGVKGNPDSTEKAKKPDDPDALLANAILEHEIPARRTRLARKRHIHMLKSAKKAAKATAAAAPKTTNVVAAESPVVTKSEVPPNKKARVFNARQTITGQPVRATLGNGPGSLSASLPMYSILQTSNVAPNASTTLRMPLQGQSTVSSKNLVGSKPNTFVVQQKSGSSLLQTSSHVAAAGQPTATLASTPTAGNSVRYLSLQDLARINPVLAQTISAMSDQQPSGGGASRNAAAKPNSGVGSVPGVTCIMKPGANNATPPAQTNIPTAQPSSSVTRINTVFKDKPGNALPIGAVHSTSNTYRTVIGGAASSAGNTDHGFQRGSQQFVGAQSTVGNQGLTLTNPAVTNTASSSIQTTANMIPGPTALSQMVQLHQPRASTSVPSNSTVFLNTAGHRVISQIGSGATVNQQLTATAGQATATSQSVFINTSSAINSTQPTVPKQIPMQQRQAFQINHPVNDSGMVHQSGLAINKTIPAVTTPASPAKTTPTAKATYTLTVDAKMWKQLQGKPQLQQQLILNHIRQKQQQQQQQQQLLLQQQVAQQPAQQVIVQQPAQQNTLLLNPAKTVLQPNPQQSQIMLQQHQQLLLQQQQQKQSSQVTNVLTSPTKAVYQSNILQQQLLQQQPQQRNHPTAAPAESYQQPAQQIIKMTMSPSKTITAAAPQASQTADKLLLTHTQQTQQHATGAAYIQGLSSPPRIPLLQNVVHGNMNSTSRSVPIIPSTMSSASGGSKQLLHLPATQQQVVGGSPSRNIIVHHTVPQQGSVNTGIATSSVPVSSFAQQNLQQTRLLLTPQQQQQAQGASSMTLSPHKQVILQQKIPNNNPAASNVVTIPLSALLNRQVNPLQQQQQQTGKPSFVYVLPPTSAASTLSSQGAHQSVMIPNAPVVTYPNQGVMHNNTLQSVLSMANNPRSQLLSQNASMQSLPSLVQSLQGHLQQQQQPRNALPNTNVSHLLQQARAQQNFRIPVSSIAPVMQNIPQPQGVVQVMPASTAVGAPSSSHVLPAEETTAKQPF